jgi:hypothetical protein
MREALAITLGFFSGVLVYVMVAIVLTVRNGDPFRILVAGGCFVVTMILSATWMLRGTKSVALVFRKGFLLGASEWMVITAVALYVKARNPQLRSGVIIGFATLMLATCLIGYGVANVRARKSSDRKGAGATAGAA